MKQIDRLKNKADRQILKRMAKTSIRFYQKWISPLSPPSCRFSPTCSHYGLEALEKHGFFYGVALIAYRILRCNPWNKGGFDPVPDVSKNINKV